MEVEGAMILLAPTYAAAGLGLSNYAQHHSYEVP